MTYVMNYVLWLYVQNLKCLSDLCYKWRIRWLKLLLLWLGKTKTKK